MNRGQTIQQAAQLMAQDNISSLLIVDPDFVRDEDDPQSPVLGIITDRDLCTRVLAEGLSPQDDVSTVMTTEVI
ncbi:CBS domain-containing protein, partial [Escherichia coli]|nr:CBS domain-containing protein [Escherichia coli]